MEKSETIIGKRTQGHGNMPCESSVDNAPVLERGGHAGELPSSRATSLSENCSVVMSSARTWFKRKEVSAPNQFRDGEGGIFMRIRIYVHEEHSGVRVVARLQSLMGKAGKDLGHRRPMRECACQPHWSLKAWRMRS